MDHALTSTPVELVAKPDVPIACTLDAGDVAGRLEGWKALLGTAHTRERVDEGTLRIQFGDTVDLPELVRLIAAEHACCEFFSFAVTIDGQGTALQVGAPEAAREIVDALFGP